MRRLNQVEVVQACCLLVALVMLFFCASARAGTVTVKWNEPVDRDLSRCRITVQNAQGAAINTVEVVASNTDVGHETAIDYDTRALQGQDGKVVGWCTDVSGQTSVQSSALPAKFPDVAPAAPKLTEVSIVP